MYVFDNKYCLNQVRKKNMICLCDVVIKCIYNGNGPGN